MLGELTSENCLDVFARCLAHPQPQRTGGTPTGMAYSQQLKSSHIGWCKLLAHIHQMVTTAELVNPTPFFTAMFPTWICTPRSCTMVTPGLVHPAWSYPIASYSNYEGSPQVDTVEYFIDVAFLTFFGLEFILRVFALGGIKHQPQPPTGSRQCMVVLQRAENLVPMSCKPLPRVVRGVH